jgi:membrane-associated phospholipid phosphatase
MSCVWEVGVAAVLAGAFALLAVLITLPAVIAWDARTASAVNTAVAADATVRAVAVVVTTAGSPVAVDLLTAVAVTLIWLRADRPWRVRAVLYLVTARLVELGVETAVKSLTARPRPLLPHPLATAQDTSFPSGHTAGTAVLCVSLLVLAWPQLSRGARAAWSVSAAAAIIAVGVSRVLLGVHYPTDVLGGALWGMATALGLAPIVAVRTPREALSAAPKPPRHP